MEKLRTFQGHTKNYFFKVQGLLKDMMFFQGLFKSCENHVYAMYQHSEQIFAWSFSTFTLSSKLWSSQLWTQFKKLRTEAWKSQDFNRVWTRDLAIPVQCSNQLSYEATDVGSWSFVSSNEPVKNGCVHNCNDHSLILDFKSAVQYHILLHFHLNIVKT